jgi:N-acetylglucosamine kinase-like BadF-type ATPase
MEQYFFGVDIGGTKSHALLVNAAGEVIGFAAGGAGNYEGVGWDGYTRTLQQITEEATAQAGIEIGQITGAGFGVAGYDWPFEREQILAGIDSLGLECPFEAVNDTIIGLIAGASEGWGVVLVAGTSNNCRGRDHSGREGRVTGNGIPFGEFGGSGELIWKATQEVARAWTQIGPPTRLTEIFIDRAGAANIVDLLEGLQSERYTLHARDAPLVFQAAREGDRVAGEIIHWAGCELGALVQGVVRQLKFQDLAFEVILVGSMFNAGDLLRKPMAQKIRELAPKARFNRLKAPPVIGGVLLGMEQTGLQDPAVRDRLIQSTRQFIPTGTP